MSLSDDDIKKLSDRLNDLTSALNEKRRLEKLAQERSETAQGLASAAFDEWLAACAVSAKAFDEMMDAHHLLSKAKSAQILKKSLESIEEVSACTETDTHGRRKPEDHEWS